MNNYPSKNLRINFSKIVVWTDNKTNTNLHKALILDPAFIRALAEIVLNILYKNLPAPKLNIIKKHKGFKLLKRIESGKSTLKLLKVQLKSLLAPQTQLIKMLLKFSFPQLKVILNENTSNPRIQEADN